jgi:hypothetical protein
LVKQESTHLFHFNARRIRKTMRRDVLAILDMVTPCIGFVAIDNGGLFPTIHVSETIPLLKPVPVSKPISVSEPVPVSKPISVSEPVPVSKPISVSEPGPVSKPISVSEPVPVSKPISVSEPVPVSKPIPASKPILPNENFAAGILTTTNQTEFAPSGTFQRRNLPGEEQNFWKNLAFLIPSLHIYLMDYRLRRS